MHLLHLFSLTLSPSDICCSSLSLLLLAISLPYFSSLPTLRHCHNRAKALLLVFLPAFVTADSRDCALSFFLLPPPRSPPHLFPSCLRKICYPVPVLLPLPSAFLFLPTTAPLSLFVIPPPPSVRFSLIIPASSTLGYTHAPRRRNKDGGRLVCFESRLSDNLGAYPSVTHRIPTHHKSNPSLVPAGDYSS